MKNTQILKSFQSTFILSVTLLLFSACSQTAPIQPVKRPNVIFIMADDQRSDMLSTNGNPYVKTPHLDRLAAEGCNFKNAFAVSGVCSPSRADWGLFSLKGRFFLRKVCTSEWSTPDHMEQPYLSDE